jgi:hypothetical protein
VFLDLIRRPRRKIGAFVAGLRSGWRRAGFLTICVAFASSALAAAPATAAEPSVIREIAVEQSLVETNPYAWGGNVTLSTQGCSATFNPQVWDEGAWHFLDGSGGAGTILSAALSDPANKCMQARGALRTQPMLEQYFQTDHLTPGDYRMRFILPPGTGSYGPGTMDEFGTWTYPRVSFSAAVSSEVVVRVLPYVPSLTVLDTSVTAVESGQSPGRLIADVRSPQGSGTTVVAERRIAAGEWEIVGSQVQVSSFDSWYASIPLPPQAEDTWWRLRVVGTQHVAEVSTEPWLVRVYPTVTMTSTLVPAQWTGAGAPDVVIQLEPKLEGVVTAMHWVYEGQSGTGWRVASARTSEGVATLDVGSLAPGTHLLQLTFEPDGHPFVFHRGDTTVLVTVNAQFTSAPVSRISGDGAVGRTLIASLAGAWDPAPISVEYQWYRDGEAISGATASTYRLVEADGGASVTVQATGARPGYASTSVTSGPKAVARLPLTATPTPTITGVGAVGKTLTANPGTWKPSPVTLSYRWYRNGVVIPDATASTYKLVSADAGRAITVRVVGSKTGYTSVGKTSASKAVAKQLTSTPTPKISGTGAVGKTLTAIVGVWEPSPVTLKYQWYRDGAAISGATAKSYKLVAADAAKAITVRVTGSRTGYTSIANTSAAIAVGKQLTTTPTPTISGTGAVGNTLTANPGTWKPSPVSLSYRWYRNGEVISGETSSTYNLVTADAGKTISVRVVGSKTAYTAVGNTSAPKAVAKQLTTTPTPKISGTGAVGETLTAIVGVWQPSPVTLKYQWFRDGAAISGATAKSYKLVAADAGKAITVQVTGSRTGYTSIVNTSAAMII